MKMKYVYKTILITSLILLCCSALLLSACSKEVWTFYELRWDLEFPDDVKTEFNVSAIGFPSDGITYSIFSFKNRPDKFLEDFNLDEDRQCRDGFEKYLENLPIEAKSLNKIYDESKVVMPKDDCIWRKLNRKHTSDSLYMAYDETELKLYVIEHLM